MTDSDGVVTKEMLYHWAQELKERDRQPILSAKELAELEIAWKRKPYETRNTKQSLSLKYFPEADPRYYGVYHRRNAAKVDATTISGAHTDETH